MSKLNNKTDLVDIDYPILTNFVINSEPIKDVALSDPVLCFNNLNVWIIIDIDQMLKTPIIWTKIYKENKTKDVTIALCPRTLRASMFEGKLKAKHYDGERLILETEEKSLIPIDLNIAIDLESNFEINKRYQISIQTLRNSLVDYYDIKYLHPTKKTNKYIINKNYLNNRLDELDQEIGELQYHPKTLVYILQYVSDKGERKITIIIGSNSNLIDSLGYDNKKSGFDKYISDYENEIIKKDCFIMQMLYYKAIKIYENAKKVTL